jgi:hypothetical protein
MEVNVMKPLFAGREGCYGGTTKALTYERLPVDIEEAQSLSEIDLRIGSKERG